MPRSATHSVRYARRARGNLDALSVATLLGGLGLFLLAIPHRTRVCGN
jgi:hypothetical protein